MKKTICLDGRWRVRFSDYQRGRPEYAERDDPVDEARYLDATVPGAVHIDLMRAGLIQDPRIGTNVLAARWVEEQIWSYRKLFDAPEPASVGMRAWLVFESIEGVGRVVLNGRTIAEHANSFLPLRIEVTGMLRARGNVLTVHVESGLWHVADKPGASWFHHNAKDQTLHKRHWLRKVQSQHSWDWAPRLMNVGLGSVRLDFTHDPIRLERLIAISRLDDDLSRGAVEVRAWIENLTDGPIEVELSAAVDAASAPMTSRLTIPPGLHRIDTLIPVDAPALWWPIGHGAQTLYDVRAAVRAGECTIEAPTRRVGFRHIRIDQSPHSAGGRWFVLQINHRSIFCKGGNLVPADIILADIDRSRYETLVDRAIEANFNMLRVWGGGLYEHDDFYDLCDERGILVWQEFIYACSKYPLQDKAFRESAIAEARHQLRRLAHHASLVIWCGNNENDVAVADNWAGMADTPVASDFEFFHQTLPRLCRDEDGTRFYQPSSPFSPDLAHPNDPLRGDQHPWQVGIHNMDFRDYRKLPCRFPNEGGFLGPTSLPTMLECLPEGQRFIQSFAWQLHDNSVDSWVEPSGVDAMTQLWLGIDCRSLSIEQYAYWGGLIQAEGLREYIDNFRRRMFDSAAAVFWMYNDVWPAVRSWTVVDYALRRTPSFHPVRRAFAPISVVLAEQEDAIVVFGINDTPHEQTLELRYGVFRFSGTYPVDERLSVVLPGNASTELARLPRSTLASPTEMAGFAELRRDGNVVARNRLILPLYREIDWPVATIDARVENGEAVFSCDVFALQVCIDLDGAGAVSDNFFDIFPGTATRIPWPAPETPVVRFVGNTMRQFAGGGSLVSGTSSR